MQPVILQEGVGVEDPHEVPELTGVKPFLQVVQVATPAFTIHAVQFEMNCPHVLQLCWSVVGYVGLLLRSLLQLVQYVILLDLVQVEQNKTAMQELQIPIIGGNVLIDLQIVTPAFVTSHPLAQEGKMLKQVSHALILFPVGNNPELHPVQMLFLHRTQFT